MGDPQITPDMAHVMRIVKIRGTVSLARRVYRIRRTRKWRQGLIECDARQLFARGNGMLTCVAEGLLADYESATRWHNSSRPRVKKTSAVRQMGKY